MRGGVYVLAPVAAVLAGVLAAVAVALAIALNLAGGPPAPAAGAATLVPADALLYLHVSTDPSRPEVRQALSRLRRFAGAPLLFAALTDRLDSILTGASAAVDFASQVRPWVGNEVGFAVLNTPGSSADTLTVLDVRNRARARAFLVGQGAVAQGSYRRVALWREPSGTVVAFLGHYLALGQQTSVTSAIDVVRGWARSLASSTTYERAADGEPADRVIDFYAPVAGIRRALVPRQGLLGALGTLLDQPALSAVTVTVSPTSDGLHVRIHSALDPKLARENASRTVEFAPSLTALLPGRTMMLLDAGSLRRAAPKLLAAAARLGIAGRVGPLLARLGGALAAQGVDLDRLFSIFGREAALAIVPGAGGSGPAPVLVARTERPRAARRELANLEVPLTQAFAPPSSGGGVVPEVTTASVDGATTSELSLAPGFQLDWAVAHGLVVLSTSPGAIATMLGTRRPLSASPGFGATLSDLPGEATSLVFLDLDPLLRLGEQTGLIASSTLAGLRRDLERVRAIGLVSTSGESDTTTELQLQIR